MKTTKKLDRQKQKFYQAKDKVRALENSIRKSKMEIEKKEKEERKNASSSTIKKKDS